LLFCTGVSDVYLIKVSALTLLSIREINMLYFRDTKIQAIDALLNEARQFAYGLLQNWNMGRCQEDIVILYARDNSIVILFFRHAIAPCLTLLCLVFVFNQIVH